MHQLVKDLRNIVGWRHVLTSRAATRRYRTAYREGGGEAVAVVRPGTLRELWDCARICIAADKIIILQAANTGLTGGSTPDGAYDRDVVIIHTLRLDNIRLLNGGTEVLCHAGATLYGLENALRPIGREPHSVIGSSCIGASVVGGVCNNSGGALIRRGPAYTEYALYARVNPDGQLELVNHLGIDLGTTPDDILARLDRGDYASDGYQKNAAASDPAYIDHVRAVDAPTPARYNADPRRLYEASGSAGRIIVFAVRLDTFAAAPARQQFYIGTNDPGQLTQLRRGLLTGLPQLPIAAEYMHRDAYDVAAACGRDMFWIIYRLGTGFLPRLFAIKGWLDAAGSRFGIRDATDRCLQHIAHVLPQHLPPRLQAFRKQYAHYLLLDVTGDMTDDVTRWLSTHLSPAQSGWFVCTPDEGRRAQLHRFVAAGAAIRYRAVHRKTTSGLVALDIALRRNDMEWLEALPPGIDNAMAVKLYYGHFFCHVFHQDYVVKAGHNAEEIKAKLLALCDARGAEYPAEHNVGHAYAAKPALAAFYRALDPCNTLNPGIGKTPRRRNWQN